MTRAPIVAEQLSLLGDPPTPGRAWQRPCFVWHFGGLPVPPSDEAIRQMQMLTPDSHRFDDPPAEIA